MVAPLDLSSVTSTSAAGGSTAARAAAPVASSQAATNPALRQAAVRPATPHDRQFLTVEPDGRDDISFMDRLRHALRTVFDAVQKPDEAAAATERALKTAKEALTRAVGSRDVFVQIRVVGLDVAYADGKDRTAYASYRRLGVEIGVARAGAVRAEDTAVVGLDGRSFGLTPAQIGTGLKSGLYRRNESGGAGPSTAASERLNAAQTGLARVKATQDALKAYRSGDFEPLKRILVDGKSGSGNSLGAVFPGTGALPLR